MSKFRIAAVIALGIALQGCASVQTPVVPDGNHRTPINTAADIQKYQARTAEETANTKERTALSRQMEDLNRQLAELKAYVAMLQANQEAGINASVKPPHSISPLSPYKAPSIVSPDDGGETIEVRGQSMTFRVSHAFGKTAFVPSRVLSEQILAAAREARHIDIRGRTDANADNDVDLRIARQRALRAKHYLESRGIDSSKIRCSYLAAGGYLADNKTEQGRARNRRVEIEMMDVDTAAFKTPTQTRLSNAQ